MKTSGFGFWLCCKHILKADGTPHEERNQQDKSVVTAYRSPLPFSR